MLTTYEAQIVASIFQLMDGMCRTDLNGHLITSERDYVSNFTSLIRRPFGIVPQLHQFTNLGILQTYAYSLNGRYERQYGCDGKIVFKKGNQYKIGMFEAKWPRYSKANYIWDDWVPKANSPISRFSRQLEKQSKVMHGVAIWEMFINEEREGRTLGPFKKWGSTNVWHADAYAFLQAHQFIHKEFWKNKHLDALLPGHGLHMYQIIKAILTCNRGKVFGRVGEAGNGVIKVGREGNDKEHALFLPDLLLRSPDNITNKEREQGSFDLKDHLEKQVKNYMRKEKIGFYAFVDLAHIAQLKDAMNWDEIIQKFE